MLTDFLSNEYAPQWISALGTLLLACVALWGNSFKTLFIRPKLILSLKKTEKEAGELTYDGGKPVRYYHLILRNKSKFLKATDVQINLIRVDQKKETGQYDQLCAFEGIPFCWQFHEYLERTRDIYANKLIADLCKLTRESFQFTTYITPNVMQKNYTDSFDMQIHIRAQSVETSSNLLVLRIKWDGVWTDEGASNVKIEDVSKTYKKDTI
ncbi:MAG: hypothetical protein CMH32_08345 [Micavibrio sp.]|nr:hypothetical protein [Micavibrio sp.]